MNFFKRHWLAFSFLAVVLLLAYMAYAAEQAVQNAGVNFVAWILAKIQSILPSWLGGSTTSAPGEPAPAPAAPAAGTFSDGTPINSTGNFYIDPLTGIATSTPSFLNYANP